MNDNTSCPNYDCLSLEATVDDDGPFSDLSASWAYSPSGSRSFSDNSSLVSTTDNTQGKFRAVFNGYRDSDAGKITLTVTDAGNRQGCWNSHSCQMGIHLLQYVIQVVRTAIPHKLKSHSF